MCAALKAKSVPEDLPGWFREPRKTIDGKTLLNGRGQIPAKIMILGFMPLPTEVQKGDCFSSDTGRLAVQSLAKAGIRTKECYFTDAVKYASKKVSASDVKFCSRMLREEIKAVNPELIVCFGAKALSALVGPKFPITLVRGELFDPIASDDLLNEVSPYKVLAVHSLDQIQHNPELIPLFERDLKEAVNFQNGTPRKIPECQTVIATKPEEVSAFRQFLFETYEHPLIALDCEWHGKNWMDPNRYFRTIQMGYDSRKVFTIKIAKAGGERYSDEKAVLEEVRQILENPKTSILGQNVIADGEWLLSYGIDIRPRVVFDTMLAEYILHQNLPLALDDLSMRYSDYGRYCMDVDLWVHHHPKECKYGYGFVPEDMLLSYAGADVDVLRDIMDKQAVELEQRGYLNPRGVNGEYPSLFQTTMNTQRVIYEIERNGMPVDHQRLEELITTYQGKKAELLGQLSAVTTKLGMTEFNPNSSGDLRKLLFDILKLPPVKATNGKAWGDYAGNMAMDSEEEISASTDKGSLEILENSHPVCKLLLNYRRIDQPCKTWLRHADEDGEGGIPGEIWPDGKIHSHFSQLTETGRFRTSSPNCQNFPKKADGFMAEIFGKDHVPPNIRTIVAPPKGWMMMEGDFCQAELFTMANLSGDQNMISALTTPGKDLHDKTAIDAFMLHMYDENGHEVCEDDLVKLAADLKEAGGAESDEFQHFMKTLTYVDAKGTKISRAEFKSGIRVSAKSLNFGIP